MELLYKTLKVAAVLIVSVVIILFAVSVIMEDRVTGLIIRSLNNNFSTKLEAGSYRLSLLKKFPKASFELRNVLVHSSNDFDRTLFAGINTDTLLYAKSASLDFRMTDLLKGRYTFEKINLKAGRLNLYTDTAGHYNYDVGEAKSKNRSSGPFYLDLKRIYLSDMNVLYHDLNVRLTIRGLIKSGHIKSHLTEKEIDFDCNSDIVVDFFRLRDFTFARPVSANLEVGVLSNEKGYFFRKSTMHVDDCDFVLTGFIASDNYLDLTLTGNDYNISGIGKYLPEKYGNIATDYRTSGLVDLLYRVKGKSTRSTDPHYELSFSLKDGLIARIRSGLKLDKLSFSGLYSNGSKNSRTTSSLMIRDFTAKLGSAGFSGSFSMFDFTWPKASLDLKGTIFPGELKEFFNLSGIESAGGSADFDVKFAGRINKKAKYSIEDIPGLNSGSEISFKSFRIRLAGKPIDISDVNGKAAITETTVAKDFSFVLNGQKIMMDCNLRNLPGWAAGLPVSLAGTATVYASSVRPETFFAKPAGNNGKKNASAPLVLPGNLDLEVNFNVDTLVYKTFRAEKIKGILSLKPRSANFRSITLRSQKGSVSGNGLVVQNLDKSFIGRGSFLVSGIDVNEAFRTFHNFGQNFLKAENIAGSLSGSFTLVLPVDSLLKPDMKTLTAEGKYVLTDGALINFDPVKALSSFVELSELENIKFDRLENDFFIKDYHFYVPQMDVRSSAVDLSVNGKHSFDNVYTYHVRILLSEILSNKARRNKTLSSEFGDVEDDGLGRTSVFLKVEGVGENVKVSYDMKAAADQVRNNIKKERQTLKEILNEEYGRAGKDSAVPAPKEQKRRFRISWEGSDTVPAATETKPVKKEGLLEKIFKKK